MDSMDTQIWTRYQTSLKNRLSEFSYSYLENMTCCQMSETRWEIALPDRSTLNYVETNLIDKLNEVLHEVLRENGINSDVELTFCVENQKRPTSGMLPFDERPVKLRDVSSVSNKTAAFQRFHYIIVVF